MPVPGRFRTGPGLVNTCESRSLYPPCPVDELLGEVDAASSRPRSQATTASLNDLVECPGGVRAADILMET